MYLQYIQGRLQRMSTTLHVDDLILSTEGPTEKAAAQQLTAAATTARSEIEDAAHMLLDRGHKVWLLAPVQFTLTRQLQPVQQHPKLR